MVKYNIDKENGVVEAVLDGCANDALARMNKRLSALGFGPIDGSKFKMKDTFKAKAKCHPEDTFDEEVGKEIARSRVLNKYHSNRILVMNRFDEAASMMGVIVEDNVQKSLKNFNTNP